MSTNLSHTLVGGTVLGIVFGLGQALAADATQIADSLVAAATASGNQASYDSASANGDDVVISGFTVTSDGGDTISAPSIVVSGAEARDQGGFTASRITFDNAEVVSEDSTVTWATGAIDDATVPSPDEIDKKARVRPFSQLSMTQISVTGDELAAPVSIAGVDIALDVTEDGTPRDFALQINGVDIPEALLDVDPQQKAILEALGYSGFTISVDVEGGYEADEDTLTLRNLAIDTVDVGKLSISGIFSGVSPTAFAEDGQSEDILKDGRLDSLTIRFDNAGIVERALDMQAEMMGSDRDAVVAQFSGALPFMLNAVGNPPLQEKLAAAGQAFLKDPQSVTISAMPSAPVPFADIIGAVQQNPQSLPDLLIVDVSANN